MSPEVFRQRLSRARRALEAFTRAYCGLVRESAPCRCSKRVARAEALGRIQRGAPVLAGLSEATLDAATRTMESLHETARLMRF